MKISILFIFFLSFFGDKLYSKTIVCMRIFHIPNDCSATWHPPFLVWGGVRATTGKLRSQTCRLLSPKELRVLGHQLLGFLLTFSGRGTYSQATPGLLNAWNHESRSST